MGNTNKISSIGLRSIRLIYLISSFMVSYRLIKEETEEENKNRKRKNRNETKHLINDLFFLFFSAI